MSLVGASITKFAAWRGGNEEYSNVYFFQVDGSVNSAYASALIDALKAFEQPVMSTQVTFKVGRVWTAGGTAAANQTVLIKDLTGPGSMTPATGIWRELAFVVNIDAGRTTTTGRRIYLRKYVRSTCLPTSGAAQAQGDAALTSAQKSPFQTYGQNIRAFAPGGLAIANLASPSGTTVSSTANVTVLDYLHNRQFKQ